MRAMCFISEFHAAFQDDMPFFDPALIILCVKSAVVYEAICNIIDYECL